MNIYGVARSGSVRGGKDEGCGGFLRPHQDSLRTVCVKAHSLFKAGRTHPVACLGPSYLCHNSTAILYAYRVPSIVRSEP